MKSYASIDKYIQQAPVGVRETLRKIRSEIKSAAPNATESIKYGMPTFELHGNLVHFAAMKGHLGFYPAPSGITAFQKELAAYSTSKGCIRFPYHAALPYTLIKKIVKFRVKENTKAEKQP